MRSQGHGTHSTRQRKRRSDQEVMTEIVPKLQKPWGLRLGMITDSRARQGKMETPGLWRQNQRQRRASQRAKAKACPWQVDGHGHPVNCVEPTLSSSEGKTPSDETVGHHCRTHPTVGMEVGSRVGQPGKVCCLCMPQAHSKVKTGSAAAVEVAGGSLRHLMGQESSSVVGAGLACTGPGLHPQRGPRKGCKASSKITEQSGGREGKGDGGHSLTHVVTAQLSGPTSSSLGSSFLWEGSADCGRHIWQRSPLALSQNYFGTCLPSYFCSHNSTVKRHTNLIHHGVCGRVYFYDRDN